MPMIAVGCTSSLGTCHFYTYLVHILSLDPLLAIIREGTEPAVVQFGTAAFTTLDVSGGLKFIL